MVDLRVKGAVIQRLNVEQKSLNMNVDASSSVKGLSGRMDEYSLEELERMERSLKRINTRVNEQVLELPVESQFQIEQDLKRNEEVILELTEEQKKERLAIEEAQRKLYEF
jgi:hypothetical protein